MKNKIKLSIGELKVESFLTSKEMLGIHGGVTENACFACNTEPYPCQSHPYDTYQIACATSQGCTSQCQTSQGCHTSAATCNYTNYGTCTCAPSTADYTACYC